MRNLSGELVSSEERAETLAAYLEQVQWAVRPTTAALSEEPLGPLLPINMSQITEGEVAEAAKRLKNRKACGIDRMPGEFWKAICQPGTLACQWAVELCRRCWDEGKVPEAWHEARVASIFKKGDVADCGNYRPISLLQIGYKLFAVVLLLRLKLGRAEDRIWFTQFGFCSKRGTLDAVFLARRAIEDANAIKDKTLMMLALDWAKAFDCISPQALIKALARFGLPEKILAVISGIYTNRKFYVSDAGVTSQAHTQEYGICQGCPLSPFLLRMLMTVLIGDAKRNLQQTGVQLNAGTSVHELLCRRHFAHRC